MDLFKANEILAYILVILTSSIEFWFTKNVSGRYTYNIPTHTLRLLVGLKWLNDFKTDGSEIWIYQSHDLAE